MLLALAVAGEEGVDDASPWALAEPGSCAAKASATEDAQPLPTGLAEGDVIAFERLPALEAHLPADKRFKRALRSENLR